MSLLGEGRQVDRRLPSRQWRLHRRVLAGVQLNAVRGPARALLAQVNPTILLWDGHQLVLPGVRRARPDLPVRVLHAIPVRDGEPVLAPDEVDRVTVVRTDDHLIQRVVSASGPLRPLVPELLVSGGLIRLGNAVPCGAAWAASLSLPCVLLFFVSLGSGLHGSASSEVAASLRISFFLSLIHI